MAGFLDGYGAGDARREKTYLYAIGGTVLAAALGFFLYLQFRDYREVHQVSHFLNTLRSQDYQAAYKIWGCTEAEPCLEYQFAKFMEDWGPQSPNKNVAKARVVSTIGCDTGLISDVRFETGDKPVLLWAERNSKTLGFFPYKLRPVPDDFRSRTALAMWKLTRNCKPLIE